MMLPGLKAHIIKTRTPLQKHLQGRVKIPTGGTAREPRPFREEADPEHFRSRQ